MVTFVTQLCSALQDKNGDSSRDTGTEQNVVPERVDPDVCIASV